MNLIAHRGLWTEVSEKNNMLALSRAIDEGFGIETDVREYNGRLVLSHDVADADCIPCADLFNNYMEKKSDVVLALNVKEDGIQEMLKSLLDEYSIQNYFMFDMSIPEMVVYDKMGFYFFSRQSDIENFPVMYNRADGVWIDAFFEDWDMLGSAKEHLSKGKKVSLISPEIHGKAESSIWKKIKTLGLDKEELFYLCTDLPVRARGYFEGEKV